MYSSRIGGLRGDTDDADDDDTESTGSVENNNLISIHAGDRRYRPILTV